MARWRLCCRHGAGAAASFRSVPAPALAASPQALRHAPSPSFYPPLTVRPSRCLQVAACGATVVLLVVALAAVGKTQQDVALGESGGASSFQEDSEAAIKIKAAKDEYDQARGKVHALKEGLGGLEERLSRQLKVMDAARDDLVQRIKRVEKLPDPAKAKRVVAGGTALAEAPLKMKSVEELRATTKKQNKVKGIAKRIMFPDSADKNDPLTKIEDSVLKKAWGDGDGPSDWKCRVKPKTPGCDKFGKGRSKSGTSGRQVWLMSVMSVDYNTSRGVRMRACQRGQPGYVK
jgi:hypothetical protein